jgi:predicted ATPase/DNA-binding winged helix-turn-helix (wHTH) protein
MIEAMPVAERSIASSDNNDCMHLDEIRFGEFVLLPQQQVLLRNGEPVPLGSRAMLLLIALASRPRELLEKKQLLDHVWPRLVVEECNLRAQVLALRRALGDCADVIVTVAGRGYRFVAPISHSSTDTEQSVDDLNPVCELPRARVFGREEVLGILEEKLQHQRFVTVTGYAGVGKTTVALSLANRTQRQSPDGTVCIDLAASPFGQCVASLVARALGMDTTTENPLQAVSRHLAARSMLLVFDSCEAVLEGAATVIETLMRSARQCRFLVTSREPLNADGEWVHELAPLQFPASSEGLDCIRALSYPAITLLVDRMIGHNMGYLFTPDQVPAAVALCQKLDGNALAIEIAAARVRSFGLDQVVDMLDHEGRLHMIGRRTAPPRHRSLAAALDFTYTRLSSQEQAMLAQLSVFSGSFTLRGVNALIHVEGQLPAQVLERLVDSSLVVARGQRPGKRYRLLNTTRLYATQKLGSLAEKNRLAQRHARWVLEEQKRSVDDLARLPPGIWLDRYGAEVDSVRAALAWAYSAHGDPKLASELTLVSVPLWSRLELPDECQRWILRGRESAAETSPVPLPQRRLLVAAENRAG